MLKFLLNNYRNRRKDAVLKALSKRLLALDTESILRARTAYSDSDDAYLIHSAVLLMVAMKECPKMVPQYCSDIIRLTKSRSKTTPGYVRCYALYFLGAAKDNWAMAHKARQSAMSCNVRPWLRRLLQMPFVPEFKRAFQAQVVSMY